MTNGKEFAEKMFSEIEDNNEIQEKLYSTGNDELDDLLERAFSEGYEYAQKEFGRAEREERREMKRKLKEGGVSRKDRVIISALHKKKDDHAAMTMEEDSVSEDPEVRKRVNKAVTRTSTILTTPLGAALGASIGSAAGDKKGALIGAGVGAGVELAANTLDYHLRKRAGDSKEKREKGRDRIKVAKGEMSEEKFAKKYGKKEK